MFTHSLETNFIFMNVLIKQQLNNNGLNLISF